MRTGAGPSEGHEAAPGPNMEPLEACETAALIILLNGADTPGPITDEGTLAAVMVYAGLRQSGHVTAEIGKEGPTFTITPAGRARVLKAMRAHRICPFPGLDISPEQACPVCGDLGTFDGANMDRPSACIGAPPIANT